MNITMHDTRMTPPGSPTFTGAIRRSVYPRSLIHWLRIASETRKLRSLGYVKLNFGCGHYPLDGWTNIDGGDGRYFGPPPHPSIVKLDAFEALRRIPEGQTAFITSEQFFEHFDRQDGHRLVREWFRVLKHGGVLRILTPDLEKEVKIYLDLLPEVDWEQTVLPHRIRHITTWASRDSYGWLFDGEKYTRSMLLNNGMHLDGHKYLYDFETIAQSLRLAGFQRIARVEFGESKYEELRGIDRHDGGETGKHWIPSIVLGVEATKG